jgi:hypothetical protein
MGNGSIAIGDADDLAFHGKLSYLGRLGSLTVDGLSERRRLRSGKRADALPSSY